MKILLNEHGNEQLELRGWECGVGLLEVVIRQDGREATSAVSLDDLKHIIALFESELDYEQEPPSAQPTQRRR